MTTDGLGTEGSLRRQGTAHRRLHRAVQRPRDVAARRGLRDALERHGVEDVHWSDVPGARELPVACKTLAQTGRYDAVIALGCVIRGETVHFDLVAHEASRGLGQAAVETGVPIIFGVLATENLEQALDRAGGKMGNAGWNAAVSAIETASLLERIGKNASGSEYVYGDAEARSPEGIARGVDVRAVRSGRPRRFSAPRTASTRGRSRIRGSSRSR